VKCNFQESNKSKCYMFVRNPNIENRCWFYNSENTCCHPDFSIQRLSETENTQSELTEQDQ
jgi:hypothetical protein